MLKTRFSKEDEVFRALLKELRTRNGLHQADVADRLGVPQSYVSKYETGERRLDFVETAKLCDALGMDFERFAREFKTRLTKPHRFRKRTS